MADITERINDYNSVRIALASPDDIRSWSYGEVKKPETINYRTYKPEKDGLFCERIFGPEKDWECSCGKYKGMKHKGIVCDRCGVKVAHSRARRKRMGHINLAAPVVHIWFFKAMPSRLGTLLGMKVSDLERVIYFQDYVVYDPKDTPLKQRQVLSEEQFRAALEQYGEHGFQAGMGAEAVKELLRRMNLEEITVNLREELRSSRSMQRKKELCKQIELAEAIRDSGNNPEWIVLDAIPVIPPDLRPLILLDSGNFATSDLNDLYRRIINRNNRLKKLIELNAPEVIIRNEKRMLQQSVDALFDNARCKRPVLGSGNRPLKSLTDMIKGKQGRFRENLLGKRVDYSARSVIVVGPELELHECGLPKSIALELYQPFIIRRLRERGLADSIKSAKRMLERKDEEVWDILEEVISNHPVLLNRAPTLHRMGIQAFDPILVEGNAIRLHPLVCKGFNADFDGDQMAVHLPLSVEAQIEAKTLMLAPHNIFSPQSGDPIITPSQDIVLGCYYLSAVLNPEPKDEAEIRKLPAFSNVTEIFMAQSHGFLKTHDWLLLRTLRKEVVEDLKGEIKPAPRMLKTTLGRIIFHEIIPTELPFYNFPLNQKALNRIIAESFARLGRQATINLLDSMKATGFKYSTRAGLSFSLVDLRTPEKKVGILEKTQATVDKIQRNFKRGAITEGERYNRVIDEWNSASEQVAKEMLEALRSHRINDKPYLNPVFLMMESGARGSSQQIRQLAGMRGLMAKPSGRIIETPIRSNFREGLNVLEYFSSTHGARKGLADTALKTADSGYLTRKLADVAQNVVICEDDCGTTNGVTKGPIIRGDKIEVPLSRIIVGRIARDNIVRLIDDEVIVRENELITPKKAAAIEEMDPLMKMRVRSPLTCESRTGLCAKCYGMDLATKRDVEEGLAVGIVAAQSIGEPGTQLTMRTFHIGGVGRLSAEEAAIVTRRAGTVKFLDLKVVENDDGEAIALKRNGEVALVDDRGREIDKYQVPLGAIVRVKEGAKTEAGQVIADWDPHVTPIISEVGGRVRYEDIVEGKTMRLETDQTGTTRKTIIEHKGDMHPQIILEDNDGNILAIYPVPEKAHIQVEEGQKVKAGAHLARTPMEVRRTQDITGGLPRVTEIFEARKPKDPAVMSELDGRISAIEKRRGRMRILVKSDTGIEQEHMVPSGKHLLVKLGDYVRAGEALVEGPLVPQDILRISGEEELQQYMLREVQNVYRSQNVHIDDKHIEIIISRMTRKVEVEDPGDTNLLPGQLIDKFKFRDTNEAIIAQGGRPATGRPTLQGITKAALQSDSFISAASFQETTKVLTQAALAGKIDGLEGLKENVILGHLVPAGTGFRLYYSAELKHKQLTNTEGEETAAKKELPV